MNSQAAAVLGYQYNINHHLKILMSLDFFCCFSCFFMAVMSEKVVGPYRNIIYSL